LAIAMTNRFYVSMSKQRRNCFFAAAIIIATSCIGCGNQSLYEVAVVHGTVTLDGKPLTGGKVMFAPIAEGQNAKAGKPGFGALGPDGSFVISTYGVEDGAVVGKHWVSVMRNLKVGDSERPSTEKPEMPFERVTFPQQQTVVAGQENKIDIALTSAMLSD
jgi:hypothetical protein